MPLAYAEASNASAEFVSALQRFKQDGLENERIRFNHGCPPVKVERLLTQLLSAHPELEIQSVEIDGRSGCEYFRGLLRVDTSDGEHQWEFVWDCKWKAEQEGWVDAFGLPDQIRAAQTFGYDCFREWSHLSGAPR